MTNVTKQETFKPPQSARNNAKRGLELREANSGKGGTAVGVARARDLVNGKSFPIETVRRMHSFFSRHDGNQEGGNDDEGRIAWLLWGGDSARRWARGIVNRMDKYENTGEAVEKTGGQNIIGGWFSVWSMDGNEVVDSDNEVIDTDSYAKVAVDFAINHRVANFDHAGESVGHLVDNILIDTPEFAKMLVSQITGMDPAEVTVKRLGHFGSFHIPNDDDYKKAVESKPMFSIEGQCERELVDE